MMMKMSSMVKMTMVKKMDVNKMYSRILYGGKIESSKEMQRHGS